MARDQKSESQQQQNKKALSELGIELGASGTAVWCVTSRPPRQLSVFRVSLLQNKVVFPKIWTCMNNYIWQFLIFTEVGFTALVRLKSKV